MVNSHYIWFWKQNFFKTKKSLIKLDHSYMNNCISDATMRTIIQQFPKHKNKKTHHNIVDTLIAS